MGRRLYTREENTETVVTGFIEYGGKLKAGPTQQIRWNVKDDKGHSKQKGLRRSDKMKKESFHYKNGNVTLLYRSKAFPEIEYQKIFI